ncbi:hypothetical protein FQN49_000294 [Arthroderma sp. PD_2]|nr:hypothetical protein FQN49_000294 [Arthroderma sp. PD_2]
MRFAGSSAVYLLSVFSFLVTNALAAESSATTTRSRLAPTPDSTKPSREIYDGASPTPGIELKDRAVVDAPPDAPAMVPTQVSPIMTIYVDGKQVIYTQTFPPIPDQLPTPMVGKIGLGTLKGEIGKTSTIQARSVPTDAPDSTFSRRCRTLECRKRSVQNVDGEDGDGDA